MFIRWKLAGVKISLVEFPKLLLFSRWLASNRRSQVITYVLYMRNIYLPISLVKIKKNTSSLQRGHGQTWKRWCYEARRTTTLFLCHWSYLLPRGSIGSTHPYIYKNPCHFTPSKKRKKKQLEQYHRRSSLLNICCCCLFSPSPKQQQQQQQMDLGNLTSPGWPSVCVLAVLHHQERHKSKECRYPQKSLGQPTSWWTRERESSQSHYAIKGH
jgi:hypothetical protein